jgi:hypothetical protein
LLRRNVLLGGLLSRNLNVADRQSLTQIFVADQPHVPQVVLRETEFPSGWLDD